MTTTNLVGVFFDRSRPFKRGDVAIDTNVLASCFTNKRFSLDFFSIFKNCEFLIDPIVRLEFLRGAWLPQAITEKEKFLSMEKFIPMIDHQSIYQKVYENTLKIARFFASKQLSNIPLADILIMSRLASYEQHPPFLTLDSDFSSLLFDRLNIISIEKETKYGLHPEHISLLQINTEKLRAALD